MKSLLLISVAVISTINSSSLSAKPVFDKSLAWPLCGRIMENSPAGFLPEQGCPEDRWGNANHSDQPLSFTFGPTYASNGYKFSRSIAMQTNPLTPVFAVSEGKIITNSDTVMIEHKRLSSDESCLRNNGCYYTVYGPVQDHQLSTSSYVEKGQLIGYVKSTQNDDNELTISGNKDQSTNDNNQPITFQFAVLNAPGVHDPKSNWKRDAIHPLKILAYPTQTTYPLSIAFHGVRYLKNNRLSVTVKASLEKNHLPDLKCIELKIFELVNNGSYRLVEQKHTEFSGLTPENKYYAVNPPWFDMEKFNRQYTFKNSSRFPYSYFKNRMHNPFFEKMPDYYDSDALLERAAGISGYISSFNGITLLPLAYTPKRPYELVAGFSRLTPANDPEKLCIMARGISVKGQAGSWHVFKGHRNKQQHCPVLDESLGGDFNKPE